ncbi:MULTISPECIES: sorbosone dehydrogenase family protein [unclassified Wenzhouxiangella]|uniref:PQQ-dependent sugar dehydrogenase n=1 Tax=unclassified Wenzhouxiangella TaxID=2613841 RepID=UPI000E32B2B7|nr:MULTISPECIES: PQQ-dependent sugar dehydrogenase [unclassified Wenzhouxiangella]RFF27392.1 glucose dehydrogenase [Wenzhouxiangella sp. 15181]RFP68820.1 glucose dehydrogenase [Wenzhouxiangella sp. 15190]
MPNQRYLLLGLAFLAAGATAQIPTDVTLDPAFNGESFATPVALRHAGDGSGRKFVVERAGTIHVVDDTGTKLATPFLDRFEHAVDLSGEGGLLGLAFHPDYLSNGRFYVYYTWNNGTGMISRVAEFTVSTDPDVADPGSERVILEVPQPYTNHNGGDLHFGPDGYLWIGLGDGGSGNDPCNRAQTLNPDNLESGCGNHPLTAEQALLGKMLRIDVDTATGAGENNLCGANADGSAAYSIPADNPWVTAVFRDRFGLPPQSLGVTGGECAETWAYGLRNPYRFSFDRDNGDLWIGDVGQSTWEEIDLERASDPGGDNYGWRICEASYERGSTTQECTLTPHHAPVHEYLNADDNCSVTGGFRYRGPVTSLQGRYVFGDFCSGRIWFMQDSGGGSFSVEEFGLADGRIYGFGEDEAGELYVLLGNSIQVFNGTR